MESGARTTWPSTSTTAPSTSRAMLGAYRARVAPFNVNYRYVARGAPPPGRRPAALAVIHSAAVRPALADGRQPGPRCSVGARRLGPRPAPWRRLVRGRPRRRHPRRTTGGPRPTTCTCCSRAARPGAPRGCCGARAMPGRGFRRLGPVATSVEVVARGATGAASVAAPPFMHGAGQWGSFKCGSPAARCSCRTSPSGSTRAVWRRRRERVTFLLIVGDAFARPLIDESTAGATTSRPHRAADSAGAPLSARAKAEFQDRLPLRVDRRQPGLLGGGRATAAPGAGRGRGDERDSSPPRTPRAGRRPHRGYWHWVTEWVGWPSGSHPLGYLDDRRTPSGTFPTVGGDAVRRRPATGPDSWPTDDRPPAASRRRSTPAVRRCSPRRSRPRSRPMPACTTPWSRPRPSERWGEEIVAVVRLRPGWPATRATQDAVECRRGPADRPLQAAEGLRVRVDEVVRSPSGKADYQWAPSVAARRPGARPSITRRAACSRSPAGPRRRRAARPRGRAAFSASR